MAENRWQVAVGAVILALMLLAGAFSLGVYVGRHGLSREGLSYQPEGGPGAGPLDPQARPQGLPADQPDLIGRLRARVQGGIELATQTGLRFIAVDENTQLLDPRGSSLEAVDIHQGDILAIYGELIPGDGQQLLAVRIIRLPQQPPAQP